MAIKNKGEVFDYKWAWELLCTKLQRDYYCKYNLHYNARDCLLQYSSIIYKSTIEAGTLHRQLTMSSLWLWGTSF